MRKIFWEILARLGFWIPCNKYLPNKYWDWVLISYCDNIDGFRGVPLVAEYINRLNGWYTMDESIKHYINNNCMVTHWHRLPRKIKDKQKHPEQ